MSTITTPPPSSPHLQRRGQGSSATAQLLRDLRAKGGKAAFAAYEQRRKAADAARRGSP